ncbi:MAG: HDOD domain-containing protein [Magnetococcus sp. DMHC-1]|nr:HDOD domain-containing protein [Magnetococcales bacterium]
MTMRTIARRTRELIAGVHIPVQPAVLQKILTLLDGFSPNLAALAAGIGEDVALAGRILQRANIESRKLQRCVDSVEQGVMLLGLQRVGQIVVDMARNLPNRNEKIPVQWPADRGVQVGRIAAWLAGVLPDKAVHFHNGLLHPVTPDTAYTLGLLHDCGLMVLMYRLPEYAPFHQDEMAAHGHLRAREEWRLFGTDHGLAGACVAKGWCLPETFCQAIQDHNQEGSLLQPGRKRSMRHAASLCGILNLAEWILARTTGTPLPPLPDGTLAFFGLEAEDLESMVQSRRESP